MKRHAAFFIGLLTILLLMGWGLKDNIHILNETWWKSIYSVEDINKGTLVVKPLKSEKDGTFYMAQFAENSIQRLDVLGIFSDASQTVYLDMSNHYLMMVKDGIATHKIFINDEMGEVKDAVTDGRGNIYVYAVKYGEYASWIQQEKIVKYDKNGKPVSLVYDVDYQEGEKPFLSGTITNLSHDDTGLKFYRNDKSSLTHYSYTYELTEDFKVDLSKMAYQLLDVVGDELGSVVFATSNSEIGLIKANGSVEIIKSYLADKRIVKSLAKIGNDSIAVMTKGDWLELTEVLTLSESGANFELVDSATLDNNGEMVDQISSGIKISSDVRLYELGYLAIFTLFILLILYSIYFCYRYLMQGRIRVAVKQLLILLPIVLVIMLVFVLQSVLNGFEEFGDEIKQGKYAQFNEIIDYQLENVSNRLGTKYVTEYLESIAPYETVNEVDYSVFYDAMSIGTLQETGDRKTEVLRQDIMAMYVVIDRVVDGKAYKILDTENKFKFFTPRTKGNKYFEKAVSGQQVNAIGTGDAYIFSMRPIRNEKHEIVGIYQIGMKYAGYRQQLDTKLIMSSVIRIVLLTAILMIAITITTVWSLRTIGTLTKGVREVTAGNLDVQIDIRSTDEVSELADAFNGMTKSLRDYIEEMEQLNEAYYRFVPQEIFKLLGNEDIKSVYKGDSDKFDAVLMAASIEGFYEYSEQLSPEKCFELINNHLGCMGPIIRKHGGLVERYTDMGLIAIFPEGDGKAVAAAVEIGQTIQGFIDEGKDYSPINMALHRGEVLVGVIGEEKRLQSGIISDDVNFIQQLLTRCENLSSRILMTEWVCSLELRESTYETRYLGVLKLQEKEETYKVYDVFDGDRSSTRLLKRQYADVFLSGVSNFESGDYYVARSEFVKILEMNLKDGAARTYFHAADKYLREDSQGSKPLEV